ncbi:MAG: DUF3592 domain-containing protein [Planctomycetales bacterium]
MDEEAELARFKWLLISGVAFLISAFFAWSELQYALRSRTVEAELVEVRETYTVGRRGRRVPKLEVEYRFTEEDGALRLERDDVSTDWPLPEADTVAVQYFPGAPGESRLAGHRNWIALVVFFGTLAVVAVAGWKLWREARAAIEQSNRFTRNRRRG